MITEKEINLIRGKGKVPKYKDIFPPNLSGLYDNELVNLTGEANRAIGNLNSYARIVPNPDLLIGPMLLREAISSSRIEGTQVTARDIVQHDAGIKLPKELRGEALEVVNHRESTKLGIELLKKYPLSNRVMKQMHQRLMFGVRGEIRRPGEFREGSNAIAHEDKIDSIIFLPPLANEVENLMFELEKYFNQENSGIDPLLRCALSHYEFEAIHPFADGNGRIGRVLMSLFLIKEGVLEYPLLYLSGYLLREREAYYKLLLRITTHENWSSWLKFFLRAVKDQAWKSRTILEKIYFLYRDYRRIAENKFKSSYAIRLVDHLFTSPVVTAAKATTFLGSRHSTTMFILRKMVSFEMLKVDKSKKRNIPFYNEKLISLLEEA